MTKTPNRHPGGRPTIYTVELAGQICTLLADGMSLKDICAMDDMPARSSVYLWLTQYAEFSGMYMRAREEQADTLADEMLEIADDGRNDWMRNKDPENEGYVLNGENVRRSQLRLDARKWVASKMRPTRYGDKLDLNVAGKLEGLSESSLDAKLAVLLKEAGVAAGSSGQATAQEPDETKSI